MRIWRGVRRRAAGGLGYSGGHLARWVDELGGLQVWPRLATGFEETSMVSVLWGIGGEPRRHAPWRVMAQFGPVAQFKLFSANILDAQDIRRSTSRYPSSCGTVSSPG